MEPMMQVKNRIEAGAGEIQLKSPADYSAMKENLIREARIAQAAAIRAAFARLIAAVAALAVTALAARQNHPTCPPSPQPEHGD
jgi:ABC-type tungstate transport system substrate-binding protein